MAANSDVALGSITIVACSGGMGFVLLLAAIPTEDATSVDCCVAASEGTESDFEAAAPVRSSISVSPETSSLSIGSDDVLCSAKTSDVTEAFGNTISWRNAGVGLCV
eukprot:Blabericola_migrator_1__9302@NODE_4_length_29828_cov_96_571587_g3_i0_p20_GENE_NODE_4_length_29828_cov_96_571587_g3_i0NODE_4_length_29828_cov_96_571587_g3_i0_p20_ORF_typecomplete_len107_score11_15_NODE_4_length_29828_cov_96_571587_g3_i01160511925